MVVRNHFPPPNMDKPKPRRRINNHTTNTNLCLPRFRTTSCGGRTTHARHGSPAVSLLDRVREAVFRLIMMSALTSTATKATHQTGGRSSDHRERRPRYSPSSDSHHSEAVADCIEFIKKSSASATTTDESRDSCSSDCSSACGGTAEVVFPVAGGGYLIYRA